ncbi:hypothetical protein BDW42DRAFT_162766 [Aspergillus taichungensis]|uniref:Uncharacterized protein n=1 Tax=Aspergillus taichungensis TaxID=482145 RepID=A0A2J5I3Q1_9EURO|nr:hypothetical protein BDW42DRAFT_162766 [Aspergillus taichungensis]
MCMYVLSWMMMTRRMMMMMMEFTLLSPPPFIPYTTRVLYSLLSIYTLGVLKNNK